MFEAENPTRRCFVDTNVWLYAFVDGNESQKRSAAKAIISHRGIVLSTQVINETCINLLRKTNSTEGTIRELVTAFYAKYAVIEVSEAALLMASALRQRYSLSFWDSMIVASALQAGCEILYTEDMQDGLEVEHSLTVVNPFRRE